MPPHNLIEDSNNHIPVLTREEQSPWKFLNSRSAAWTAPVLTGFLGSEKMFLESRRSATLAYRATHASISV